MFITACPRGKYGSDCAMDCLTCYNGGMCEESSGVCVCPPGFMGDQCEIGKIGKKIIGMHFVFNSSSFILPCLYPVYCLLI